MKDDLLLKISLRRCSAEGRWKGGQELMEDIKMKLSEGKNE